MRIIAGKLGGLQFESPKGHKTHPMSEKMRGALFNALGDISGLTVFDAYGGSGAMAFEAISRGAASATICEIDKHAISTIQNNIAKLKLSSQIKLIKQNSAVWAENNLNQPVDLVICDPPYNNIKQAQLTKISQVVKPRGLFILSLPPDYNLSEFKNFKLELKKSYGDSSLIIYRKI